MSNLDRTVLGAQKSHIHIHTIRKFALIGYWGPAAAEMGVSEARVEQVAMAADGDVPKQVVIYSLKGGSGKSATTLKMGYALAALGKRVLIVDADPQSTVSELAMRSPNAVLEHRWGPRALNNEVEHLELPKRPREKEVEVSWPCILILALPVLRMLQATTDHTPAITQEVDYESFLQIGNWNRYNPNAGPNESQPNTVYDAMRSVLDGRNDRVTCPRQEGGSLLGPAGLPARSWEWNRC